MDILFRDAQLQATINNSRRLRAKFGKATANNVLERLDDMRAASSLQMMFCLPGKCEPLKGSLKGCYSVRVSSGMRLVFEPATRPLPVLQDGGVDIARVTAVKIIDIEDYHG